MLAALLLLLPASGEVVPVDFATLSGFDYAEGMQLPEKVRALDGKKIGVAGFIRTEDGRQSDISVFWLVDKNCDCAGRPKMNEVVLCEMPEGQTITNDDSLVRVVGRFAAGEELDGDYVVSIYRLRVESVE